MPRPCTEEALAVKTKFDKLSELYGSMRNDHLVLLKQKQQFATAQEAQVRAAQSVEQLQKVGGGRPHPRGGGGAG